MTPKQKTLYLALLLGSNAITCFYMASLSGRLLLKDRKAYDTVYKTALIHRKAVLLFAEKAPREVSEEVLEEVEFDWVVRDLEPIPTFDEMLKRGR